MMSFENSFALWIAAIAILTAAIEFAVRRRWTLSMLTRVIWIATLGFLLAEWTKTTPKELSQYETLHVVVDRSDSIALIPERKERAEKFLTEINDWAKKKGQPVQFLSFGENVESIQPSQSGEWLGDHDVRTRLRSVQEYIEKSRMDRGAVVLVSDGNWSDTAHWNLPTYSVQLGDAGNEKDVWIENLQNQYTAFLRNRLKIPFEIAEQGYNGERVHVELRIGNDVVDQKDVRLEGDRTRVELTYFPEKMGERIARIKVTGPSGELSTINNDAVFKIRVVRDKIRILHVGGKPSLDLKAWRIFLTRQPDVDLVSFYILRSLSDDPEARNNELSLIPFPYEDLFTTELEKFDLVILQNFDFNLYFQDFYLANLAEFVRKGGAVMMVGGDQSFDRYLASPLDSLFPFAFDGMAGRFVETPSKAQILKSHPIIRDLESVFQNMTWTGHHLIRPRADAVTLISHQDGSPLLSLRQVEKGRMVAINSDESWSIQMNTSGNFSKLARRLLQYLTFDPEMDGTKINSSPWHVHKNTRLEFADHRSANWKVSSLWTPLPIAEQTIQNAAAVDYRVPSAGVYQVQASELSEPVFYSTEEQPWRDEWKTLVANNKSMQAIAKSTHGEFFTYDNRKAIFDQSLSGQQILSATLEPWAHTSNARSAGLLAIVLIFLFVDFLLRKRIFWDA